MLWQRDFIYNHTQYDLAADTFKLKNTIYISFRLQNHIAYIHICIRRNSPKRQETIAHKPVICCLDFDYDMQLQNIIYWHGSIFSYRRITG